LWFLEIDFTQHQGSFHYSIIAQSIAQVTRYFTAFYSNSLDAAHQLHYIKEPLIS